MEVIFSRRPNHKHSQAIFTGECAATLLLDPFLRRTQARKTSPSLLPDTEERKRLSALEKVTI